MLGICNGFQALIKLGLVPYGKIIETDESCPTLTYQHHRPPPVQAGAHPGQPPTSPPGWPAAKVGQVYTRAHLPR